MIEPYDIDRFTYIKERKEFVAEASDLGKRAEDKIPATIQIHNSKTGNTATFCYQEMVWNGDNEIIGWRYLNDSYGCTLSLLLFND